MCPARAGSSSASWLRSRAGKRAGRRVPGAELALEDLPRGGPRKVGDEVDRARQLVAGELLAGEGDQLIGSHAGVRRDDNQCLNRLAPAVVGDADDRDVDDRGVLGEHLLYLDGIDVLSAA